MSTLVTTRPDYRYGMRGRGRLFRVDTLKKVHVPLTKLLGVIANIL